METIVLVAVGMWLAVVFVVISLCRVAKRSDDAMDAVLARANADVPPAGETLRTLDLGEAAALLGVNPETLRAWEARYGFPTSSPSDGRYSQSDVLALRDSIAGETSVAAAIARARQRGKRRPRPTRPSASWRIRDDGFADSRLPHGR